MSEDSVKINGVVQVVIYVLIGLAYMGILYVVTSAMGSPILENSVIVSLAGEVADWLRNYDKDAGIAILTAGILLLSLITGMLVWDLFMKFTLVSPFLLFIITVIDLTPIKIIITGIANS